MVSDLTPQEVRSKELGRMTMLEGTKLWKRQKEDNYRKQLAEKREVRKLLENYWPWGRPGGGAPNSRHVGIHNTYLEEIYPIEDMQRAKRQVGSFEFGRGGASYSNRRRQKQIRLRKEPVLRFQRGDDLHHTLDNTLRYQAKRAKQLHYKQQLDALVEEKKRDKRDQTQDPKSKLDFEKKMGWTSEAPVQKIRDENCEQALQDEATTNHHHHRHRHCHFHDNLEHERHRNRFSNGVELVPLIVRRRPSFVKAPLGTTDVTRGDARPHRAIVIEPNYLSDLTQQVNHKRQRIKDALLQDVKGCLEHFKTWSNFWGRPGHGAPRSVTQKGHLMSMLYPQVHPMHVH